MPMAKTSLGNRPCRRHQCRRTRREGGRRGAAHGSADRSWPSAIGGSAFELDVEDAAAISASSGRRPRHWAASTQWCSPAPSCRSPTSRTPISTTWIHAFSVNAVGANNVLRAALPHLSENGVVLVASSNDVGRPRAGVAAYGASKAALDEILHSWRGEHPELSIVRVGIGPTAGHRDSARRRSRPSRAAVQVVGGTRATPRADVGTSRRRQHLGVARHHGARRIRAWCPKSCNWHPESGAPPIGSPATP